LVPEFRATEPLHMKKAVDDLIAKLNNGGPDNQISAAWRQAQPNLHAVEDYRNRMCSPENEKLNNPQNLQVFKEICIENYKIFADFNKYLSFGKQQD